MRESDGMDIDLFVTPGLGDNSYLLRHGDEAALIDPQRDVWRFLETAERHEARVRYVLETHVHNDYVSGAIEARRTTGAQIAAPAKGGYAFEHLRAEEGFELQLGDLRLVAIDTPGHTPEHIAWVVYAAGDGDPIGVFTGGSLIVGNAGRTDLLGPEHTAELTRAQYATVRRIAALPPRTQILPTHGGGSFCVAGAGVMRRTTTLADELEANDALRAPDEQAFVAQQLSGLQAWPAYYRHMGPINRAGPDVLGGPPRPPALSADDVRRRRHDGVWVVDGRKPEQFAQAHIPGSVNIRLDSTFGTYVGWVVPWDTPIVLVLPDDDRLAEAVVQLLRIGISRIEGYLDGGLPAWTSSGEATSSYPAVEIDDLCHAFLIDGHAEVLDVRQATEWDAGHIPGSTHVFVGELRERLGELREDLEYWVICASGARSAIAASLLARDGIRSKVVVGGGVAEWLARCNPVRASR